jgi:hypothetical protein
MQNSVAGSRKVRVAVFTLVWINYTDIPRWCLFFFFNQQLLGKAVDVTFTAELVKYYAEAVCIAFWNKHFVEHLKM